MAVQGQRVWSRVEAPGTARGHALVARFGGEPWRAWENANGSWNVQYGDGPAAVVDDWAAVRATAERWRDRAPPLPNPLNPYVANAAAAGSAIALRAHFAANPQVVATEHQRQVCSVLPREWLADGCALMPTGVTRVTVRRGLGSHAVAALRRARLPFAAEVVER